MPEVTIIISRDNVGRLQIKEATVRSTYNSDEELDKPSEVIAAAKEVKKYMEEK